MKLPKMPIISIVAILSLVVLTGGKLLNYNSDSYALVGDGYCVVVNKEQFEQFGKGDFADLDLDRFVEQFNLKKIYDGDSSKQITKEDLFKSHNLDDSALEPPAKIEDGIASSRPA